MKLPGDVLSALAEGRQAHLAIETPKGPHVTPGLYVWSDGALWLPAATTTLKARALRSGSPASAVVLLPGREIVLAGSVDVFDARRPFDLARKAWSLPKAVRAGGRFALRNSHELAAFVGDAITGKLGRGVPPPRVFFSLRPDRAVLIEGDVVAGAWGWDKDTRTPPEDVRPPPGGESAVVGLPGPLALPARWFEARRRLYVSPAALALSDVDRHVAIAVVVDEYNAPGPAAKWGRLLRGTAVRSDDPGYFDITDADVVEWDGVEMR